MAAALVGFAAASAPLRAEATYSILAVDVRDGTLGGAVASCVPLDTVARVYGAVPGKGALVTQSYLKNEAMPDGLAWIVAGRAPDAVLAALLDPSYDPDFALRQYAVVSVDGRAVGFTGAQANPHASNVVFSAGDFAVAIQGNYLTGPEVLTQARAAFESDDACDLPERLMRALEAAGVNGAGDARCVAQGSPAESALIQVDPPGQAAGSLLRIGYPMGAGAGESPLPPLRAAFEVWRQSHPCPEPEPAAPENPAPPPSEPSAGDGGCAVAPSPSVLALSAIFLAVAGVLRRARRSRRP